MESLQVFTKIKPNSIIKMVINEKLLFLTICLTITYHYLTLDEVIVLN